MQSAEDQVTSSLLATFSPALITVGLAAIAAVLVLRSMRARR